MPSDAEPRHEPPAFRVATPDDAPTIGAILQAFNEEFGVPSEPAAVYARRLCTLLAGSGFAALLAAPEPVALATVATRESVYVDGRIALLEDLWVEPTHRGSGIGSALLAATERLARESGCDAMEINVDGDDTGARRFYERHGYRCQEPGQDDLTLFYFRDLREPAPGAAPGDREPAPPHA